MFISLFIAYSSSDTGEMETLRANLLALGIDVWVARYDLSIGEQNFPLAIQKAIQSADGVIAILSPDAKQSHWFGKEILAAQQEGKPIFPVLVAGNEYDAIPLPLVGVHYQDFRGKANDEAGFRELVRQIAVYFDKEVPDYTLDTTTGEVRTEQSEADTARGQIVTVQGDVHGNVTISGGNIESHPIEPPPPSPASPPPPPFPWVGVLAIVGALLVGGVAVWAVLTGDIIRPGPPLTPTPITPPPTVTNTAVPTATETPSPTTSPDTPVPTPEPTVPSTFANAEAGVETNAAWLPFTREFNGALMALVPNGCFQFGSTDRIEEGPVRTVCFEEPFWIDVYEVTNGQIGFADAGCLQWSSEDDQPHICVSWFDARNHCTQRGARLPTEAEWEYTARGPDGLIFPWGDNFFGDNLVYRANSGMRSQAVGSRSSGISWVGAHDLSGNVNEWINDWFDENYYGTLPNPAVNPPGPAEGDIRVIRGGKFNEFSTDFPTTRRDYADPDFENFGLGFRCARDYVPGE